MSDQAIERLRRRRTRLWLLSVAGVGYIAALTLKIGIAAAVLWTCLPAAVLAAVVSIAVVVRRRQEARRRVAGGPPSWLALMPKWTIAQYQQLDLPRGSDQNAEVVGRLYLEHGAAYWTPTGRETVTYAPVRIEPIRSAVFRTIRGLTTIGYLRIGDGVAPPADIWVVDPKGIPETISRHTAVFRP